MSAFQRIELMMGTGIDIDVRKAHCSHAELEAVVDAAFCRLDEIEQTFSTYIYDSEISRLGRGEISLDACIDDVRLILDLSNKLHAMTSGFFDIYAAATTEPSLTIQRSDIRHARPLEPSGVVKGWAIEQAVDILRRGNATDFCIYAGGDMYLAGEQAPGESWRIGLQHPTLRDSHMAALELSDVAIATSGFYERGAHIVRPDAAPLTDLMSVTIVGGDVALADAYATAVFAMGMPGITWALHQPGFEVYAVDSDGQAHWSASLRDSLIEA